MRLLAVMIAVLLLTGAYVAALSRFKFSELPGERHFGAAETIEPAGEVYFEPVGIDAFDDAMQLRAYLMPSVGASEHAHVASNRDLTLLVTHDKTVEEVRLAAGDHIASATFEVDLNGGSVTQYPLDSYVARVTAQLVDGKSSLTLPARVTMWEGVLGYSLHTTSEPESDPNEVELGIAITRSGAFALFALCAYGAMLVLGCCALVIGVMTFADVRRPDATLIGAIAAIAFALPVLRNALPGSPPLGVEADMWVFLWTELAAVLALALLVFKWASTGPGSD